MLTDNQIRKLIIYRGCGYSQREIANILNISRKTVENHLHRLKIITKDNGINITFIKYFKFWAIPLIEKES